MIWLRGTEPGCTRPFADAAYGFRGPVENGEQALAGRVFCFIMLFMSAKGFHHEYILTTISRPDRHDTGRTDNLHERLTAHNAGRCPHTARFVPWTIETAAAFRSREKAIAFEKYPKSHSGRAFSIRHFRKVPQVR